MTHSLYCLLVYNIHLQETQAQPPVRNVSSATLLALLTNTQEDCTLLAAVDLAVSQELLVVASPSRWHTQRLMSLDCWFLALMMVRHLCLDSWA